jgi:hypothetical protein
MRKAIMSIGPIPARIDSVKFITNRFKGGLALKTAEELMNDSEIDLRLVAWTHMDLPMKLSNRVTRVVDISDYLHVMEVLRADAYILAAAVANLMPVNPWLGKFPSHDYSEGDRFDIPFTIAPRIIDRIRRWHGRCSLIGYKLFDGPSTELIRAGRSVLKESKATVVFCNTPTEARERKVALTQDGAVIPMSFDSHVEFIRKTIKATWCKTVIRSSSSVVAPAALTKQHFRILDMVMDENRHGCIAHKLEEGILTTTRKKSEHLSGSDFCRVWNVTAHGEVFATDKATINASTLWRLCKREDVSFVVHGHWELPGEPTIPYEYPGTLEEAEAVSVSLSNNNFVNVSGHGFYAVFRTVDEAEEWVAKSEIRYLQK